MSVEKPTEKGQSKSVGSGRLVGQTGAEMIAAERLRQITEEKWSYRHDDKHRGGELSSAAMAYIGVSKIKLIPGWMPCAPDKWPWDERWWKPDTNPVRNLVKAGALIAAEIDRLQRAGKTGRPNDADEPRSHE